MTRLAYILAASHSGSTLLALLLGSQPRVCTVGELKATALGEVGTYLCSCGAPISSCEFWRELSRGMSNRGFEFSIADAKNDLAGGANRFQRRLLRPLHRGPLFEALRDACLHVSPGWTRRLEVWKHRNAALVEALADVAGADVVVDSSKIGIRLKYLLEIPGLDVRVVRLIRDGRAVTLTYMDPARFADAARPERRGGGAGGERASERLSVEAAAREWRRSNEEADEIVRRLPRERVVEVRYEELCAVPGETLSKVLRTLGTDAQTPRTDFRSVQQHVVGNGMRLDSTSEIRLDERWRTTLTANDLAAFSQEAGRMNRRFGYE